MEFLGYLVGNRHEGNGTGAGQPDGLERLHDEAGKAEVRFVGIPYLVVADLKVDGYPGLAVVVELYGKRLHDVGCRHPLGRRRFACHDAAGEALPAFGKRAPEACDPVLQI